MNEQLNKGSSLIHKADPRIKIYFSLVFAVLCLISTKLIPLIACGLIALTAVIMSGVPFFRFFKSATLIIIYSVLGLNAVMFAIFGNWRLGISILFSGIFMVLIFETVTLTTKPEDMLSGFQMGFRLPPVAASKVLLIWEFLPIYGYERERVKKAMAVRGVDVAEGNFAEKVRTFPIVFRTSVNGAYEKGKHINKALKQKCFDPDSARIVTHPLKYGKIDYTISIVSIILLFVVVLTQYFIME